MGFYETVSIRGDVPGLIFQLLAIVLISRSIGPRSIVGASTLCSLAILSKASAWWAPVTIVIWLFLVHRRRLTLFVASFAAQLLVLLGLFDFLSHGRMAHNLPLLFAGSGGTPGLSGISSFLSHTTGDALNVWMLVPFAALAIVVSVAHRRLSIFQIALVVETLLLFVVFSDIGADSNHLLDFCALVLIVFAGFWAAADGASAIVVLATLTLLFGGVASFRSFAGNDFSGGAKAALGRGSSSYPAHPLEGVVSKSDSILSEDPFIPVSLAQRPVVIDPFMLVRVTRLHRAWGAQLANRIRAHEFDKIILLYRLDENRDWYDITDMGPAVSAATRQAYRLVTHQQGYWVYEPRGRNAI